MEKNRSKNFDYFNSNNAQNNQKKTTWKKVWFWIRAVLYTFIFGLTLTGCVQSIVVKSSTYTGAGTEFYLDKKDIAPSVATFEPATKPNNDKYLLDNEYYEIKHNPETNYLLSKYNDLSTLNAIQDQTFKNGGEYGKYDSYSSGIQIKNKDNTYASNHPIFMGENENRYLFKAASTTSYNSVFKTLSTIKFLNPAFNLRDFFTLNADNKTYTLKTNDIKPFIKEGYKYNTNEKQFSNNPSDKYNVVTASLLEVENNFDGNKPNLKFNRDVLELLYRQTFLTDNNYYKRIIDGLNGIQVPNNNGSSEYINIENIQGTSQKYQALLQAIVEHKNSISLTDEQFNAISKFNETILNYLKNVNFLTVENNYRIQALDTNNQPAYKTSEKKPGEEIYYEYANPLTYKAGNYSNDLDQMAYQNTIPQKPITSWAESWTLGPFFSLFAYPIALITAGIRNPLPDAHGWTTILALIIAVIITRLIALAFTWKATITQSRQEDLKQKKAKIDAKYADFKGNKQMKARQQQEIQQLYKKHGINPMDILVSTLIALPIFIAMWRVIQSVPSLKSTRWLGMDFSATSWRKLIYDGEWQYLGLLIIALATQLMSQILPRLLNRKKLKQRLSIEEEKALKKSNKTQNIMLVVFAILTVVFTAGVQIYWIFTSIWSIIQTLIIHYVKKSDFYRRRYLSKVKI
ncbi:putative preprotein translocase component [Mycoplasmopsis meleagridis]|uniref:Putative preprotein translocase component n=1 Tax=Mycoplasmopsis meleagridis ATCC 25294 TaxID=1264554 RepID=A0A0F5H0H5_9BACT|nr:membrane protein insertase YidC [Mycoplasmopsis meleagridis]KKB26703.1 putative preprotein translocase component [Mycoplasmopsis meleagridis ATCC 25294]OAD18181.1 putative preprotein translocase component [Mycoplasmopsis meleagridis]VEU77235.1 putative inner membrane protein translocase component YidC [Mycoplasmopsis meleagridis]